MKPKDVQWYDHRTQHLAQTQQTKIKKLLELDCIKPLGFESYLVSPIPNYNKRTYNVKLDGAEWICNCQHFVMKKTPCSHIGAVWEWRKIHNMEQLEMFA